MRKTKCVACAKVHCVGIIDKPIGPAIKTYEIIWLEVPIIVKLIFNVPNIFLAVETLVVKEKLVLLFRRKVNVLHGIHFLLIGLTLPEGKCQFSFY